MQIKEDVIGHRKITPFEICIIFLNSVLLSTALPNSVRIRQSTKAFPSYWHESPRSSAVRPPIYNSEDRKFESHLELGNFSELSDVKTLIKLQSLDPNKVRHWIEQH